MATKGDDPYSHGHHESVLRSHLWRTAENSAAYLLPHLRAGLELLDVGCGPGNLTIDLARRVAPGRVVGLDASPDVVAAAAAAAANDRPEQVTFAIGNVYAIDAGAGRFDVVHAHQVLQHLSNPTGALREMARVVRPGGLVAARDSDYGAFAWTPKLPLLERWSEVYHQISAHNGADADAGRHLAEWARDAGFDDVEESSSTWEFSDPDSRAWWGGLWADRVLRSSYAVQAVEYGYSDASELAKIAEAWREWARAGDATFVVPHGEILVRV